MQNPIEEIKSRLDVVEVIGSYIKLQKAGVNYRAVCPFHSEKKPSFFVSPARQIWHCFGGCSVGGDIFKFVMKIEGVEFGDALRILAQKAGVELKKQTKEYAEWKSERERLYEICELATRFFEKQMEEGRIGGEAKKYLLGRGIKEESIKKWRIGYSPDTWEGLSDFLISNGYAKEEIVKAGLAVQSARYTAQKNEGAARAFGSSSLYDRFRGRIIFPIFDINSQVIGFGGRVFKDKDKEEVAKYVNTPQTLLYDKSRTLYGLDKAKLAIRKNDACILVEGYTDLILAVQAGSENVVATSGTALTLFQLKILKRYSENLLTAFDMDIAGDAATKRGIDLAQSQGFNVKVIVLPEGLDPADFILKHPEKWEEKIKSAKSILDFYFETTFSRFDRDTPEGKRESAKILLPVIKRIPSKILQNHWTSELAKRLRVKEESIEEELKKIKVDAPAVFTDLEPTAEGPLLPKCRRELLEEKLGILALRAPEIVSLVCGKESELGVGFIDLISTDEVREILKNLMENSKFDFSSVPISKTTFFNSLSLGAEIEEIEEKELLPEMEKCWKGIQLLETKNRLSQISGCIKRAEEEKNYEKIKQSIKEFNLYSKTLCDLEEI